MNFKSGSSEFEKYVRGHLGYDGLRGDNILSDVSNSITPNVVEERQMRVSVLDIFSRLMKDRIIWLNGVVNDRMSTVTQAQLMFLENTDPTKHITMHIDTPGGSVKSGLGIVDVMNFVNNDIHTINTGMAASMGSILLSHGTKGKRSSLINSKMMIHQVSAGSQGHINDTIITSSETAKYNYVLMNMLAEVSNLDFDVLLEHHERDVWYNSDEQLSYGFIDDVVNRNEQKTISERLVGFEEYRDLLTKRADKKNF